MIQCPKCHLALGQWSIKSCINFEVDLEYFVAICLDCRCVYGDPVYDNEGLTFEELAAKAISTVKDHSQEEDDE